MEEKIYQILPQCQVSFEQKFFDGVNGGGTVFYVHDYFRPENIKKAAF